MRPRLSGVPPLTSTSARPPRAPRAPPSLTPLSSRRSIRCCHQGALLDAVSDELHSLVRGRQGSSAASSPGESRPTSSPLFAHPYYWAGWAATGAGGAVYGVSEAMDSKTRAKARRARQRRFHAAGTANFESAEGEEGKRGGGDGAADDVAYSSADSDDERYGLAGAIGDKKAQLAEARREMARRGAKALEKGKEGLAKAREGVDEYRADRKSVV